MINYKNLKLNIKNEPIRAITMKFMLSFIDRSVRQVILVLKAKRR